MKRGTLSAVASDGARRAEVAGVVAGGVGGGGSEDEEMESERERECPAGEQPIRGSVIYLFTLFNVCCCAWRRRETD